MDRTRDLNRAGRVQQGSRHFLFRDGRNRGGSQIVIRIGPFAYCLATSSQVFTGAVPFNKTPSSAATLAIMNGGRPPRPAHPALTEKLWKLILRCWDQDPHLRPAVSGVLKVLGVP